ncbi:zinc dependent phospholipase C family protein [Clostridium gasigenes]|uniref:Zinc dependent phospholipase C family protein n=1 Tax=Clostridium gasigenes TaxID=94869 RepID=A0A7X0VT81_9CLOT|nr:zinc dependent phospholipase C family protein [Clostridium gasigenes]MBB6715321.1 zinc dependent phospholipase C family protein [Clostridium gasigenes]MBU3104740.1 zinc dependent phospholipase C family protein [Clostridium gasigenes]
MLMNTHTMLAKDFIYNMDSNKKELINENHFIWGNIKPDCVSTYKFKKHYLDESLDMVVNKIQFLSSLSLEDIYKNHYENRFSQELGVVCHFLCDFFCVPHNKRWEFKSANAMKEHVMYEKDLSKIAKEFKIRKDIERSINSQEIRSYIMDLQQEYEKVMEYNNDLDFAYYVCQSVINMILDEVLINEKIKEYKVNH